MRQRRVGMPAVVALVGSALIIACFLTWFVDILASSPHHRFGHDTRTILSGIEIIGAVLLVVGVTAAAVSQTRHARR